MRKLILAGVAAAAMAAGGVGLSAQPAHAAWRCWWTGPVRHCRVWHRHPYWHRGYYHPGWWYR
ncbi:MAG: hypothetical protein ACREFK_08635 [Stellaceae bacterium]